MDMENPGISRAIPGAIIGFAIGAFIVLGLRYLQGLTPVWDPGIALILTPFTMIVGWLWGIGSFNPKLSEHGEHDHEAHDEHAIVPADAEHADDAQFRPLAWLFAHSWRILTYSLVVIGAFYFLAVLPTGLFLQTTAEPAANAAAFGTGIAFTLPFVGTFQTTQMVLFLGMVAFTILSLVVFAGIIAFLFYGAHQQVAEVAEIEREEDEQLPPAPLRRVGRGAKGVARSMRKGLPKVLGQ
jgi:hypothetical protein